MTLTQDVKALQEKVNDLSSDNEILNLRLEESALSDRLIALDNVGWTELFGPGYDEDSGPSLEELHKTADTLRAEASLNPLHVRGAQLRHSYIFGRGVYLTDLEKAEPFINDVYNKQALFSVQAYEVANKALFTDGNFLLIRNERSNVLTVVPLAQIVAVATDEDDSAKVQYLKRAWTANGKFREVWYPLARFKKSRVGRGKRPSETGGIKQTIVNGGKSTPVSQEDVIYLHSSNRQSGWTFGIPDSLAALVWSQAYKEYLRDNAMLTKALAQLAWKVTAATKSGADNAAASLKIPGVGGAAVMGQGTDVSAISRGQSVDFGNGQPLAALVATSFGVSVIALLSSPGETGGSYGAASTLDQPTLNGMRAVQDAWKAFLEEVVGDMGASNPGVSFPNISQDPIYRESQSIAQAYSDGRLHQDEARAATLELLDVQQLHEEMPKPDDFNAAGMAKNAQDATAKQAAKTVAAQGNTGSVPGGTDQNTTNHDGDNAK